ncbi:MAG: hypothetical protein M1821_004322 [Bathelium mastoideum]|nr:MAG: hypothetical protein M1821_004322 [Bathelium mastoideum]
MRSFTALLGTLCLVAQSFGAPLNGSQWENLNKTVNGRLKSATPLFRPCFSSFNGLPVQVDEPACKVLQENYLNSSFRSLYYSGFMNGQDEACLSNPRDQCLLDSTEPNDPLAFTNASCNQGTVSDYYIELQSASDIQAAFSFAKDTGIKLSIKNSGHDYLGRNSQKGSLALWTRKLTSLSYSPSFVAAGCPSDASTTAITTSAGVNFDEVYAFADAHNSTFVGAYAPTVGSSGGWVMGGGHSVLSPVYGLGIDRVLEFHIVTPDGVFRIANACQNQDLFWALRGGGGGSFGVVLSTTHKVEPAMPLSVVSLNFTATPTNTVPFMSLMVDSALRWAREGWGGHLGSHNLINVNPLLHNLSQARDTYAPLVNYTLGQNGTAVIETLPSWFAFYAKYVVPNAAPIGPLDFLGPRLIPAALFATPGGRANITGFLRDAIAAGMAPYIPVVGPYLYHSAANATSATPAWRRSLWEMGANVEMAWNATRAERRAAAARLNGWTARLEAMTPGSGAYVNEANPWTEDWREAWWGAENYGRLLKIKQKYDPDGLLMCWRCVGFEEGTEGFECWEGVE